MKGYDYGRRNVRRDVDNLQQHSGDAENRAEQLVEAMTVACDAAMPGRRTGGRGKRSAAYKDPGAGQTLANR